MSNYIVTVKLKNNPNHNPNEKVPGICPAFGGYCTDVTGAHHSTYVENILNSDLVRLDFEALGFHVTRIERI